MKNVTLRIHIIKKVEGYRMNKEPRLEEIEDYNNQESKEKRRTINIVIIGLIAVGIVYTLLKNL
jgi:hypothetical protein